jgi:hypothetical protein
MTTIPACNWGCKRTKSGKRKRGRRELDDRRFRCRDAGMQGCRDAMQAWTKTRNNMIREGQEGREGRDTAGGQRRVEEQQNNQEVTRTICRGPLAYHSRHRHRWRKDGWRDRDRPRCHRDHLWVDDPKVIALLVHACWTSLLFPSWRELARPLLHVFYVGPFCAGGRAQKGGTKKKYLKSHSFLECLTAGPGT